MKQEKTTKKVINTVTNVANYLSPKSLLGQSNDTPEPKNKPACTAELKYNGTTWLEIQNPNRSTLKKLAEDYPIQPLHLYESVLDQLPTIEKEEKYLFVLLPVPSYDAEQDKITTAPLGVFLGKKYLITFHEDSARSVHDMFLACEQNEDSRERYFKKSSSHLLYVIITNLTSDLSTLTQTVVQELDSIEDRVFDADVSVAYSIGRLRQKITRLKRLTVSLQDVLNSLKPVVVSFTDDNLSRQISNNAKTLSKLLASIEEAKETIEIYKDADFTASTEKTNKILAVLTLIFTLTIPPTVLGTFFGMNILLPGGIETGPWGFFGTYTTLYLILGVSTLLLLFMYTYFKKKKWF